MNVRVLTELMCLWLARTLSISGVSETKLYRVFSCSASSLYFFYRNTETGSQRRSGVLVPSPGCVPTDLTVDVSEVGGMQKFRCVCQSPVRVLSELIRLLVGRLQHKHVISCLFWRQRPVLVLRGSVFLPFKVYLWRS